jgi:hypothetical protein
MRKPLITAAAAATALSFAVIPAAPARALPCGGSVDPAVIRQCVCAQGQTAACGPPPSGQTPWADCNAYVLPSDKAMCADQHIAGQR